VRKRRDDPKTLLSVVVVGDDETTTISMNKLNMYHTVYISDGHGFVLFTLITHV